MCTQRFGITPKDPFYCQQAGTARPSFVANHLEIMYRNKHDPEQERALKLAAGMIVAGV